LFSLKIACNYTTKNNLRRKKSRKISFCSFSGEREKKERKHTAASTITAI